MTNLRRLKEDRDICYVLASAAYGQEYVNELIHEGDEINEESTKRITETRNALSPLPRQLDSTNALRDSAKSFHRESSIRDGVSQDEWYNQG